MQSFKDTLGQLQESVNKVLNTITEEQYRQVVQAVIAARRVFIYGIGRSGLAGHFLGMRLMHTGKTVYMAGDTTAPAFRQKDLLILISGSGETGSVRNAAEKGRAAGGLVLVITGKRENPESNPLAALADIVLQLPAQGAGRKEKGVVLFPLGTLFEISALLFLETVVAGIIDIKKIKEQDMLARHANLE